MRKTLALPLAGKKISFYPKSPGDLYVIGSREIPDRFKVGRTNRSGRVNDRLRDLQTGSPVALEVFGVYPDLGWAEQAIHVTLMRRPDMATWLHGEWFRCSGLATIETAIVLTLKGVNA